MATSGKINIHYFFYLNIGFKKYKNKIHLSFFYHVTMNVYIGTLSLDIIKNFMTECFQLEFSFPIFKYFKYRHSHREIHHGHVTEILHWLKLSSVVEYISNGCSNFKRQFCLVWNCFIYYDYSF